MNPQDNQQPQYQNPQPQYQAPPMPPQGAPTQWQNQAPAQPQYPPQQPVPGQYAQPQSPQPDQQANQWMFTRPHDVEPPQITPEVQQRHDYSKKMFPSLNLSDGEYVISAVRRHPIGIIQIWGVVAIIIVLLGGLAYLFNSVTSSSSAFASTSGTPTFGDLFVRLVPALAVLSVVGGLIATYIYISNRFYLTNESVIQEIQNALFSKHEQTVSLANIEDASYRQEGVLPHIFNYGSIRLSTEGDETTYRFNYVANPKQHIAVLNNAVEAFKNGRPVSDN